MIQWTRTVCGKVSKLKSKTVLERREVTFIKSGAGCWWAGSGGLIRIIDYLSWSGMWLWRGGGQSSAAETTTQPLLALQTINRFHNCFSQSRRRPLLGPSPGWKWLLLLSHLRHYQDTVLNRHWLQGRAAFRHHANQPTFVWVSQFHVYLPLVNTCLA